MYEQYLPVVSVALAKSITCVPVEPAYCEPSMLLVPHAEWKTIVLAYVFTQPYPVALPLRALESWNEPQPPEAPSGGIRTIEPDVSSTNMTLGTPPEFTKKSVSSPPGGLITASPKLDASREHDVVSAWRTAGRARSNATSASWRRDMIPLLQRELDGDLDFELAAGAVDAVGEPALNVTELVRAAGAIGAVLLAQRAVVGRLGERDVVQGEVAGVLRTVVPRHGGEPAGQVHRRDRHRSCHRGEAVLRHLCPDLGLRRAGARLQGVELHLGGRVLSLLSGEGHRGDPDHGEHRDQGDGGEERAAALVGAAVGGHGVRPQESLIPRTAMLRSGTVASMWKRLNGLASSQLGSFVMLYRGASGEMSARSGPAVGERTTIPIRIARILA